MKNVEQVWIESLLFQWKTWGTAVVDVFWLVQQLFANNWLSLYGQINAYHRLDFILHTSYILMLLIIKIKISSQTEIRSSLFLQVWFSIRFSAVQWFVECFWTHCFEYKIKQIIYVQTFFFSWTFRYIISPETILKYIFQNVGIFSVLIQNWAEKY